MRGHGFDCGCAEKESAVEAQMKGNYLRLLGMAVASYAAMYVLMYAMVDRFGNVYANVNQFYMAGLMAAPMVLIELALMHRMYPNRPLNLAIGALSGIALVVFFAMIRSQAAVRDDQFLRSMIPHHAGAILMCEQATLQEPKVVALCASIIKSQQQEIQLMKEILPAR